MLGVIFGNVDFGILVLSLGRDLWTVRIMVAGVYTGAKVAGLGEVLPHRIRLHRPWDCGIDSMFIGTDGFWFQLSTGGKSLGNLLLSCAYAGCDQAAVRSVVATGGL
jgi:hypothetical protein